MSKTEALAYVCRHVFNHERPVLLVSRAEGDWQFLCGGDHEPDEIPHVVGLNHLLDSDSSIEELKDLPPNWEAERNSVAAPWRRSKRVHFDR